MGDQALVVEGRSVPLIAPLAGEIKHVPDETAPEIGIVLHLRPVLLVDIGLPFLGVKGSLRLGFQQRALRVVRDVGACPVFRHRHALAYLLGELIDRLCHLHDALGVIIPARIPVEADLVGDQVDVATRPAGGRDDDAVGVDALGHILQVCKFGPGGGHRIKLQLVENPPPGDTRVIIKLVDQLAQLLLAVHPKGPVCTGRVNQGDLVPEEHPLAVVDPVPVLALRVMGVAHGGDTHLLHDRHVTLLVFRRDSPSLPADILMAADPKHRIGRPIEKESLFLGDGHGPETKRLAHLIHL